MTFEILKYQRPLMSSESMSLIYVYNEDRSIEFQEEMSDDDIKELFDDEYKVYYKCDITENEDGTFNIKPVEQVAWQIW